jgi:hypothetical protein
VVATGDATGYLHIDHPIAHPIAARDFVQNGAQAAARHRGGERDFSQRALQSVQMQILIDAPAAMQQHNLINPIGKLIASIFNIH